MSNFESTTRRTTTRRGYERALARLNEVRVRYLAVCGSNEEAAGAGDSSVWHDNFAYEENQRQMHALAARIRELAGVLAALEVVEAPRAPTVVGVGCAVRLADAEGDAERRIVLGGWDDSDPEVGRVAINSPLGQSIMGASVGESRTCPSPRGPQEWEIVAIERAAENEL